MDSAGWPCSGGTRWTHQGSSRVETPGLGIQGAGRSPALVLVSLGKDIPFVQLLMMEVVTMVVMAMLIRSHLYSCTSLLSRSASVY